MTWLKMDEFSSDDKNRTGVKKPKISLFPLAAAISTAGSLPHSAFWLDGYGTFLGGTRDPGN